MTVNKLDVQAAIYSEVNRVYELDDLLTMKWYTEKILRQTPHGSALSLGLGQGQTARKFATKFRKLVVIEGSPIVITNFKEQCILDNIEIAESLFEEFETKETFNVIIMAFVLEHVDDPHHILRKYKKYLNCNGTLWITVPNALSLHRRLGYEAGFLQDIYQLSDYDIAAGHQRYFDVKRIESLLFETGYDIKTIEGLFLKPFTTSQLGSLNLSERVLEGLMKIGVCYPELSNAILVRASRSQFDAFGP